MSYPSDRSQPAANAPGPPPWSGWTSWDPGAILNDLLASRPLRVGAVLLAFIWWWPIGLATLFFMMWSKRMGYWTNGQRGVGQASSSPWTGWGRKFAERAPQSSGNRAFDEYRTETMQRLEEEQRDFVGFLDRLRFAKDKAEFDQFLAERRQRPEASPGGMPPGNMAPGNIP